LRRRCRVQHPRQRPGASTYAFYAEHGRHFEWKTFDTTARTFAHPSNGTERAPKRAKRWSSARHVPAEQSAVQLPTGADRLIGLAGLAGAFAAQRVGRLHDRGWSLPTTGAALLLLLNQIRIFSISDEGRSRLNTAFVTTNFVGGAVGSAAAATRWSAGG